MSPISPLKPGELNKLKEPNRLYKLHDATFSPCPNEELMLIWNSCAALTNQASPLPRRERKKVRVTVLKT
jgi:hypothetical protein